MRVPKYRKHASGQAFVEHRSIPNRGRRYYLGKYGTTDSIAKYNAFLERLTLRASEPMRHPGDVPPIAELVELYLLNAEQHYKRPHGVSRELRSMEEALRQVLEVFGDQFGDQFGPRSLVAIQRRMVRDNYARKHINRTISRIKKFWRWCCKEELVKPELYHALLCVTPLYRGEYGVRESEDVGPALQASIDGVLPFLCPTVAQMVQTQYYCGMRPGETCIMRAEDIDVGGDVWLYRPQRHKTAWRGFSQIKAVPKKAREIIEPLIGRGGYLFRPWDALQWSLVIRQVGKPARTTPIYPSETKRIEREKRRAASQRYRNPSVGQYYTTGGYSQAIAAGFRRAVAAGVQLEPFSPKQLRNAIATNVSQWIGQQAAQRWCGHEDLNTTNIYTQLEAAELIEIAKRLDERWENGVAS